MRLRLTGGRLCGLLMLLALAVPAADPTPAVAVAPLSIRGVNYFPRETPWGGLWTRTSNEVWGVDMQRVAGLGANTIRTFLMFNDHLGKAGLLDADGRPTPLYFQRIDALLSAANSNGVRAILCFEFDAKFRAAPDRWRMGLEPVLARYRDDARVLFWDAMNEPDDEAKWNDATKAYLRAIVPLIRQRDTNHPVTVGLAFRTDRLGEVDWPDVLQYHEYAPKSQVFKDGTKRILQSLRHQLNVAPGRPLFIGEFGMSTARDERFGVEEALRPKIGASPGTEAEQAKLYETVLAAAEEARIAGVLAWCLYDYPINNPNESHFGLLRADGTLKPAAGVLKKTFVRWKTLPTGF